MERGSRFKLRGHGDLRDCLAGFADAQNRPGLPGTFSVLSPPHLRHVISSF